MIFFLEINQIGANTTQNTVAMPSRLKTNSSWYGTNGELDVKISAKPMIDATTTLQYICILVSLIRFDHSQTQINVAAKVSIAQMVSEAKNKAVKKPVISMIAVITLVLSMCLDLILIVI